MYVCIYNNNNNDNINNDNNNKCYVYFKGASIIPRSAWSIDPFGHTSTMAYVLQESGLKNMLIQRVHYSIKKHFSQNKYLEFNWKQLWGKSMIIE